MRSQLRILKDFISSFDFMHMNPDSSVVHSLNSDAPRYALVSPGRAYAVYLTGGRQTGLKLDVPSGQYRAEWVDPRTGRVERTQNLSHREGSLTLSPPPDSEDIALRLVNTRVKP